MYDILSMEEAELFVDFYLRAVTYPFGNLDEVTPAFATTISKRNLFYTRSPAASLWLCSSGGKSLTGMTEGAMRANRCPHSGQGCLRPTTAEAISAWRPDRTTPHQQ